MRVGLSAAAGDLYHLSDQLQQARTASYHTQTFSFFDDLGTERYLSCFIQDDMSQELYKRIILQLREYDNKHNGRLIETLEAFFRCNMNRNETAESLFVHPETLRYRLNKIFEITGSSPYSSDGIFQLMLALGIQHFF